MRYTWKRWKGYEVSSKGDWRFSAFHARLPDGRSIEQHYQCDVKGYDPGGTNWRLGKGQPPLDETTDLWEAYLSLWKKWADANPKLIDELRRMAGLHNGVLADRFASTDVNQARALAEILNERFGGVEVTKRTPRKVVKSPNTRDFVLVTDFFSSDPELAESDYHLEVELSDDGSDDEEDDGIDILSTGNCGC